MLAQLNLRSLEGATGLSPEFGSIGDVVSKILQYVLPLAGFLLLIYLLFGGFQFMTAAGDPKAMDIAKQKITNALIGFIIVFASYWLVQVFANVFDLEVFRNVF